MKNAIIEQTIESATHGYCSQLFHSCMLRNFGPGEDGNFSMVKVNDFGKPESITLYFTLFDEKVSNQNNKTEW